MSDQTPDQTPPPSRPVPAPQISVGYAHTNVGTFTVLGLTIFLSPEQASDITEGLIKARREGSSGLIVPTGVQIVPHVDNGRG